MMTATMRNVVLLIVALVSLTVHGQMVDDIYGDAPATAGRSQTDARSQCVATKQRLQALNDSVAHNRAAVALQRGMWVLQADRVTLASYTHQGLNENANFVFQQGDQAMVQVALNQVSPGLNGVGGITLEGRIGSPNLRRGSGGELCYSFHVMGTGISAQVMVTVFAGGNRAEAIVMPDFGPGQLTLRGRLVPYRQAE